jgi:nucleoside-triphosphatase THEP1
MEWISDRNDVSGILQPVRNGRRHLYFISNKKEYELEVQSSESDYINVGRYKFSKKLFDAARVEISNYSKRANKWLIIDEYGKLETDDRGLEPAVTELIKRRSEGEFNLIIVIRDTLLDEFLEKFSFEEGEYEIISKDQLNKLTPPHLI